MAGIKTITLRASSAITIIVTIDKASGSKRLLEIPKSRLKEIQRTINFKILSLVPMHECAHGFIKGRSIASFADQHVAKAVILSLDLSEFFCSIPAGRVFRIFRSLGYCKNVSAYLAGCCLHRTSSSYIRDLPVQSRSLLEQPHLPQGSPSSPSLANLSAFNLDVRLNALAQSMGFSYSRYADDLAFSCDAPAPVNGLLKLIEKIVVEEGFSLNLEKTRRHLPSQQQSLCGLVVNQKVNLPRKKLKALEAELYNCARHGPTEQNKSGVENYRCHLQGRISLVGHYLPQKAEKMWALFDLIDWSG